MKLRDLLKDLEIVKASVDLDTPVEAVAYDSRKVTPGSVFVAVSGFVTDGNKYIPMALEKGAVAVVTAVEGRKIEFTVEARCDGKVIGSGTHTRFIVNAAKFMAKLV